MREAVAVLIKARAMIQQGWVQGTGRVGEKRCAGQAIQDSYFEVSGRYGGEHGVYVEASRAFCTVIGEPNIPVWNDENGRTRQQVIQAFDKAIALLSEPTIAVVPEKIEATWKPVTYEKIYIEVPTAEPVGIVKKVLASIGV